MRRAVLLFPVMLLAATAAWSQGGAGGVREGAYAPAATDPAADETAPDTLTLRGLARPEPRDAPRGGSPQHAPSEVPSVDPLEEVVEVEVPPPDPVETGVSTLVVTLRDEQGGTPPSIDLELWRLGAPANEHWLAGDQRQAREQVEGGRIEWRGLPAGTYRLFTGDARVGAEDPPAFQVEGALTVIEATLALPRRVRVLVEVLDENGKPLREGRLCAFGGSSRGSDAEPAWRQERRLRHGELASCVGFTCGCCGGGGKARAVQAGDAGFDVGSSSEAARAHAASWSSELSFEGRSSVSAYVDADDVRFPEPTRYVAVSVPIHSITDHVWTPYGRRALEAGARFTTRCRAARIPRDGVPPDPRTLPIEVQVRLAGCEPLTFKTHPGERLVARTLIRAVSTSEPGR